MNYTWVVWMMVCLATFHLTPPLDTDVLRTSYAGLNSDVKSSQKHYSDSSHTKHVRSVSRHALQTFHQKLLNKSSNNQDAPRCNESHLQELSLKLDLQISHLRSTVRSIPSNYSSKLQATRCLDLLHEISGKLDLQSDTYKSRHSL